MHGCLWVGWRPRPLPLENMGFLVVGESDPVALGAHSGRSWSVYQCAMVSLFVPSVA